MDVDALVSVLESLASDSLRLNVALMDARAKLLALRAELREALVEIMRRDDEDVPAMEALRAERDAVAAEFKQFREWAEPQIARPIEQHVIDQINEVSAERDAHAKKLGEVQEWAAGVLRERDALANHLHRHCFHPEYEYTTTKGPRKAWWGSDDPPEGDGWASNDARGRNGWERFDYHEERYWMRRKPSAALAPATKETGNGR
jgi:hypothetical protein